ncbi:MAG: DUF2628 domain-containing protein [Oscillospiraceae bacterium]|nr:DUF2628 domain-containing protein [Oscillospiraceae bacterium]
MRYENDICMSCSNKFDQDDDVVVCPVCGTPQHRRCWQENGRCVNELRHIEGYVWTEPDDGKHGEDAFDPKTDLGNVCPNCGTNNPGNALVCRECGFAFGAPRVNPFAPAGGGEDDDGTYFMRGVDAAPDETIDGVPIKDAAMYVRVKAYKYIPRFIRASVSGRKVGWNWSAFIFAPFWFFYRKIYKGGAMFLGLMLALMLLLSIPASRVRRDLDEVVTKHISITGEMTEGDIRESVESLPDEVKVEIVALMAKYLLIVAMMFLPNIPAALFADYMYKNKMRRDFETLKKGVDDDGLFKMLLMRRGGVSLLSMFGSYMLVGAFLNLTLYI